VSIIDSSTKPKCWVIDIAMPGLHKVDFYLKNDHSGHVDSSFSGISIAKTKRSTYYRNPSIDFSSTPGSSFTAYIRVQSKTAIITPFFIREKIDYINYDRTREFFYGIYFGAILILALYHFYLFLTTHDRGYLWLTLFSITYAFSQMTAMYGYIIDWGITFPGSLLRFLHISYFLAVFFGIVLSRYYIKSHIYTPVIDRILKQLQFVSLICIAISPILDFMLSDRIFLIMKIVPLPLYLYSAITAYRKGYRPALNYLIATTSFISGILIYNFMYGFGILPCNSFIYFIPNTTVLITMTLYSISIAHQIITYKKEEEKAREQQVLELREKLKIQEEKCKIENELQQAKKMETVGRLLSGVAHDMNNLVNPILGYTLLIKKESRSNDTVSQYLANLSDAVNNLKNLSTNLLDITRKDNLQTTPIDINSAVIQIGSLLKHSCSSGIRISVNTSKSPLVINGDPGMVQSAIINLGINGIDAIIETGIVTINTGISQLTTDSPHCRDFGISGGTFVSIAVTDTGIGISPEIRTHLFEPYFTTKSNEKGTGLGLTRIYNCIKTHHGCISVESTQGKGSTFTLYFPANITCP
jgi:signal transduction histidine kinase